MGFLDRLSTPSNNENVNNGTIPGSAAPPSYQAARATPMLCISLHMSDRLRLINFPPELYPGLKQTIVRTWQAGIQNETRYSGVPEIKLNGNPWRGQISEAVPARMLICAILGYMYHSGWELFLSADLSKKLNDKDSLFFHPVTPYPATTFFSMSFNMTDRLRLIAAPPHIIAAVRQCVRTMWSRGIQDERNYCGAHEIKMRGNPWWANGDEAVEMRMFMLALLHTLEMNGYRVYASVDISGVRNENHGDLDSWILKSIPPVPMKQQ